MRLGQCHLKSTSWIPYIWNHTIVGSPIRRFVRAHVIRWVERLIVCNTIETSPQNCLWTCSSVHRKLVQFLTRKQRPGSCGICCRQSQIGRCQRTRPLSTRACVDIQELRRERIDSWAHHTLHVIVIHTSLLFSHAFKLRACKYSFRNGLTSTSGPRFNGVHFGSSLNNRIATIYYILSETSRNQKSFHLHSYHLS